MNNALSNKQKALRFDLTIAHVKDEIERCRNQYNDFSTGGFLQDDTSAGAMMEYYFDRLTTLFPIYFLYLLDQPSYEYSVKDFLIYGTDLPS